MTVQETEPVSAPNSAAISGRAIFTIEPSSPSMRAASATAMRRRRDCLVIRDCTIQERWPAAHINEPCTVLHCVMLVLNSRNADSGALRGGFGKTR